MKNNGFHFSESELLKDAYESAVQSCSRVLTFMGELTTLEVTNLKDNPDKEDVDDLFACLSLLLGMNRLLENRRPDLLEELKKKKNK